MSCRICKDRDVLVIDDIFDTGHTLVEVFAQMLEHEPTSLRSAVLMRKIGRSEVAIRPDMVMFDIPDEFVVGYGLDYEDRFRNLPLRGGAGAGRPGQRIDKETARSRDKGSGRRSFSSSPMSSPRLVRFTPCDASCTSLIRSTINGAASQLLVLAKGLAQHGVRCARVCARSTRGSIARLQAAEIATICHSRAAGHSIRSRICNLVRHVRRLRPDVVHTWNTIPGMLGRDRGEMPRRSRVFTASIIGNRLGVGCGTALRAAGSHCHE